VKAVVYQGPYDVSVEEVPDLTIEAPLDAIIKITTADICGSALHPYEAHPRRADGRDAGELRRGRPG
jgi:glutathione-independent formaldehyde dehydrogenase